MQKSNSHESEKITSVETPSRKPVESFHEFKTAIKSSSSANEILDKIVYTCEICLKELPDADEHARHFSRCQND